MPVTKPNISISSIRKELGKANTSNFNLNSAEDGLYVPLNVCSPSRPSANNPSSFGEWENYDHNIPCNSTMFSATICDLNGETCSSTFNTTQAQQNLVITPYTGVSRNYDGVNETWMIKNISLFPNATVKVVEPELNNIVYSVTGANFPIGGWDLIGNYGNYNTISLSEGTYGCFIDYNDGTSRTANTTIYVINTYGELTYFIGNGTGSLVTTAFTTYATPTSSFCLDTYVGSEQLSIDWPIVIGTSAVRLNYGLMNGDPPLSSKYFRRRFTNKYYRTNADGVIVQEYSC